MFTLRVTRLDGYSYFIGHRAKREDAEALALEWVKAAEQHNIAYVTLANEGKVVAKYPKGCLDKQPEQPPHIFAD